MTVDAKWRVANADAGCLSQILLRRGIEPRRVVAAGRVFVDGKRIEDIGFSVVGGAVVEVHVDRKPLHGCELIARRGELIAVAKPSGISTEPDRSGSEHSVVAQVSRMTGINRRGLHASSRLDKEVSGIVVVACSPEAVAHLERARLSGEYRKHYLGIASGTPSPRAGTWRASLPGRRPGDGLRESSTAYRTLSEGRPVSGCGRARGRITPTLLALLAVSGRFHQLRRHCSLASCSLLGDQRYGGIAQVVEASGRVLPILRTMLHAVCVELRDQAGSPWFIGAAPPRDFSETWGALGDGAPTFFPRDDGVEDWRSLVC